MGKYELRITEQNISVSQENEKRKGLVLIAVIKTPNLRDDKLIIDQLLIIINLLIIS